MTRAGRVPAATSATLTSSRISRSLARSAIQTSWRALRRAVVAELLGALPAYVGERPVDHPDDLGEGDLLGGAGQPVAALRATLGVHDAAPAQLEQDALQELRRDLLGAGDLVGRDRPAAPGTAGRRGKLGGRAEGIVDPGGEAHVGKVSPWSTGRAGDPRPIGHASMGSSAAAARPGPMNGRR